MIKSVIYSLGHNIFFKKFQILHLYLHPLANYILLNDGNVQLTAYSISQHNMVGRLKACRTEIVRLLLDSSMESSIAMAPNK